MPRQDPEGTRKGDFASREFGACGAEVSQGCGGAASSPRTLKESSQRQKETCPLEVSVAHFLAVKEVVGGPTSTQTANLITHIGI